MGNGRTVTGTGMANAPFACGWRRIVDATQPLQAGMPCWEGDPPLIFRKVASRATHGYTLRSFSLGEHSGTHVNAPCSFVPDGAPLEQAFAWPLWAPLVIIDIAARAATDPATTCTVDDVLAFEAEHGTIPAGSFVACVSGWHALWHEPARFMGQQADGTTAFPSWHPEAVALLCGGATPAAGRGAGALLPGPLHNQPGRGVCGMGIDTHGMDHPADATFACNRLALGLGAVVVECLGDLSDVPATGAWICVAPLPLHGGTGAPCTVTVFVR